MRRVACLVLHVSFVLDPDRGLGLFCGLHGRYYIFHAIEHDLRSFLVRLNAFEMLQRRFSAFSNDSAAALRSIDTP